MSRYFVAVWMVLLSGYQYVWADGQIPVVKAVAKWQADFNQPTSVVTDRQGNGYILDGMNNRIVVLSPEGNKLYDIGGDDSLPKFKQAVGLGIHDDWLYLADAINSRILVMDLQGNLLNTLQLTIPVPFNAWPQPVAVAVANNTLVYSDRQYHKICYKQLHRSEPIQCVGGRGEMDGQFQFPFQLAIDRDGFVHAVDIVNGRIQVFDKEGRYFSQIGTFGTTQHTLYRPNGMAFDALDYQYVSDAYFGTIAIYHEGHFIGRLKDQSGQLLQFSTPSALWWDRHGLYVVDTGQDQVYKLSLNYQQLAETRDQSDQDIELSRKNCVGCHLEWSIDDPEKMRDKQGVLPVASVKMCYSCHHGAVFDSRHAIPRGQQHPTLYDDAKEKQKRLDNAPRKEAIPQEFPRLENDEMLCTTCHTL
ncbi:MAG: NHL repeat-containing protein [Methylococcaceae bacterium]